METLLMYDSVICYESIAKPNVQALSSSLRFYFLRFFRFFF